MNWKRPLSLTLSAALSLSLAAPALAAGETAWYAGAQAYVTQQGLMTGTDTGFAPDAVVTRATVFQTLYNAEGRPAPQNAAVLSDGVWAVDAAGAYFTDTTGTWYSNAANWAVDAGLAQVPGEKRFYGERAVTRAETAAIFARFAAYQNRDISAGGMAMREMADYDQVPAWALEGMGVCYDNGILTGKPGNLLDPNGTAVRAELAAILQNYGKLTFAFTEQAVTYQSGVRTVPAVVTLPAGEGPFPAVVLNHGHGGSKEENGGFTGIAQALAKAGLASIRMDFPGCGASEASFRENTMTNMIADSNAGLAYLLANYNIDAGRLGILGYSMGGRVASEIVGAGDNPYQAAVLLSAADVSMEELAVNLFGSLETYSALKAAAQKDGYASFTTIYGQTQELSFAWFEDMENGSPLESLAQFTGPVLVLHGDKDTMITDAMNKAILAADPTAREVVVPDADHGYGFYSDQPEVTAAVEGSICRFFAGALYPSASLQDYLASAHGEWFTTGKREYTVQGMMVSKETSFHNELEDADYTAADDGVSVVLRGTAGEQWVSRLDKVIKTYVKADGTELTAGDFAPKDAFIGLKTKAAPDTNLAMFVPAGVSVAVETAWGDLLHTNRPNAPHGEGDYLVCRPGADGKPDLSDVWVVNGVIFPATYDVSRLPVSASVTEIEKYGHAVLDEAIADFNGKGFELGDIVTVTAGDYSADMPYLDGYYVDTGAPMLRAYPGKEYLAVCVNYGKFNEVAGVSVGSAVTVTMKEKGGAAALQATYSLKYTNDRADYASDEIFANFRAVTAGDIGAGKLYRSASPIHNENGRAAAADRLIQAAGVKTVMNLADTDEEIAGYAAGADFASPYYKSLYDAGSVVALGMPVNYASDEFAGGIIKGLTFLAGREGPYLIHCTEGKDRAGFTAALLEALMGASLEEITADYMESYVNYYHMTAADSRYDLIAQGNVMEMLRAVAGLDKGADLSQTDLAKAAETYLTAHGMQAADVAALKANLKG